MALLGFKKRFVPMIEDGIKRHTIRALRGRPFKVGETLHLYASPRTKSMRLIFRSTCTKIQRIEIIQTKGVPDVFIGHQLLPIEECEDLARNDGFASFAEMMSFFSARLPFSGILVHWTFPPTEVK